MNCRKRYRGFTIFEIIAVMAVVATILAFSIQPLLTAFVSGVETDTMSSLAKLSAALEVYRTLYKTYPSDLNYLTIVNPTLSAGPLLSSGSKGNYAYRIETTTLTRNTYEILAEPKTGSFKGARKFKIDQTGNIYRTDTIPAVVWSEVNPDSGNAASQPLASPGN